MRIKAVLFDLDGTLLPMDQDIFVKSYFGRLARKLVPHGYDPEKLVDGIWKGTAAMVKNDGTKNNEQAFWDTFTAIFGKKALNDTPYFDEFYSNEFDKVKESCGYNENADKLIKLLKAKGLRLALATNPIFPSVATECRMKWAGLDQNDFELFTTYENSRFCKPNVKYYEDIHEKMGLKAEECLMIGNDVREDMVAKSLGMKVFLLTDCLINKDGEDISVYPNGGFAELFEFIKTI
jgi:FMN phosphatase YigB (HAD superfamily)